jgi:4-hydroxy-tetrahydrodipicolinate synthase
VLPKETSRICHTFFTGDVKGAMDMQIKYLELTNALFCEVNPIPVKAAMAALGFCENYLRLPLVPMEENHEKMLLQKMRDLGLNV